MTEQEWLTSDDPQAMLGHLDPPGPCKVDLRKLRLFAAKSFLYLLTRIPDPPTSEELVAVAALERLAETGEEDGLYEAWKLSRLPSTGIAMATVAGTRMIAAMVTKYPMLDMRRHEANLLRDLFGNPFRPVTVEKFWLSGASVALARTIEETGDFSLAPLLADALEEAGCREEALLRHLWGQEQSAGVWYRCRCCGSEFRYTNKYSSCDSAGCDGEESDAVDHWIPLRGPHVRGCFVLDLILGKE